MSTAHASRGRSRCISLIAAVAENGVIGRAGGLPWHLPADLKHFQRTTSGHTCIMGRRTWEEVLRACGGPLPRRRCIVITRTNAFVAKDAEVAKTLDEALAMTAGENEVFVIGGAQVYTSAMGSADRLYITIVHGAPEGDAVFPVIDGTVWEVVDERYHPADALHAYAMTFRTYARRDR